MKSTGGGGQLPPTVGWMVDPPGGSGFKRAYFEAKADADAYAETLPARTRIVDICVRSDPKETQGREEAHTASTPLSAEFICKEAARLVGGPREAVHGDKLVNFKNIADLWNGWLRAIYRSRYGLEAGYCFSFTAGDVGDLMELFKIARRHSGSFNLDDYVDAAGYAGCTGVVRAREAE